MSTTENHHLGTRPLLEARGITKTFGGAHALEGVDFSIVSGEVHALLGANGAGKSTLIKVIAGICRPDAGEILWNGEPVHIKNVHDATNAGIAVMFQQLNVVEELTVGEYLTLGREKSHFGFVDKRHSMRQAQAALDAVGIAIDIRRSAGSLSVAERELVEIARAASLNARLVIMDEPTASLGEAEVDRLFEVIRTLKTSGVAVLYVSHKLNEVLAITDRSTVLRDGRLAGEIATSVATKDALLELMVGKRAPVPPPRERMAASEPLLELVDVHSSGGLHGVTLTVNRGEIVGVYGLMGAGRTEMLRAIYGLDELITGEILLEGKPFRPRIPKHAVEAKVGLVPEDRVREALIPDGSVAGNMTLAAPWKITQAGFFNRRREQRVAADAVRAIGIKVPSVTAPVTALSGGNQQKVVFGRWLVGESKLLLLDDPTVGVDVAAKQDIHQIIRDMTGNGATILVCSSELEELMHLADRIAIMHGRQIIEIVRTSDADAEAVVRRSILGVEDTSMLVEKA